jgi:hemerythrin-like domain-containing protein
VESTKNLKDDHITIRRVKNIAKKCSDNLYSNRYVPIEDIEIISVIIEEFVDNFHHGKEEKAYFPETKSKDNYEEEIRKFLIEHELGRRIAMMLRRELKQYEENISKNYHLTENNITKKLVSNEPVARFLKSYAVYIDDHTGKEDKFFELVDANNSISTDEDKMLLEHYEVCKKQAGGDVRIQEMIRLIEYIEEQEWMRSK